MTGPGWMPSRPRPLGQLRRRLVSYAPCLRGAARRARGEARARATAAATAGTPAHGGCGIATTAIAEAAGPFASRRAKLPVATLLPHRSEGQPRVMTGALQRWLGHRWLWMQPRLIPLLAAVIGLIGVLNARRYLLELARGPALVCPAPETHDVATPAALDREPSCPAASPARR